MRNLGDLYIELVKDEKNSKERMPIYDVCGSWDEAISKLGISEIGVQRTECDGTCPIYVAIIQSDGTVFYEGRDYVPRIGEYKGKIDSASFGRLAEFAEEIQFFNLEDSYYHLITDSAGVYTYVKKGDRQKVVHNYADAGPRVLWAFEKLIDEALRWTKWEKSGKERHPSDDLPG
jgi:hypothetical protein